MVQRGIEPAHEGEIRARWCGDRRSVSAVQLPVGVLRENGRRLFYQVEGIEFIVSRPSDVPVFVEHGAADVGIVGKDVIEEQRPNVMELRDLRVGACRMILAAPRGRAEGDRWTP